jgi:hypothetical protein
MYISMTFISLRSKELSSFSKMPIGAKPFFKQWQIHTVDVARIMMANHAEARQVVGALRSFYGKSTREVITVDEFCAFTGISKSYVRMQLVSRAVEGKLKGRRQS